MKWQEIREQYPKTWLLVEALEAYTTEDNQRILERLSVIDTFSQFYGFDFDGIVGFDFLQQSGAVIDLHRMKIFKVE